MFKGYHDSGDGSSVTTTEVMVMVIMMVPWW